MSTLAELHKVRWPDRVEPTESGKWPNRIGSYLIDGRECYRITNIIGSSLGTGMQNLIKWNVDQERLAIFDAAASLVRSGFSGTGVEFATKLEASLGAARAGIKKMESAGAIGTEVHKWVEWRLKLAMGLARDIAAPLSTPEAQACAEQWETWWEGAGLLPIRMEQMVWCPDAGFAGTADLLAWDKDNRYGGGLGVVDLKTSNYTLDAHHLQVRGYVYAVNRFFPCKWGILVKVPKSKDKQFQVTPLGKLYDRTLDMEELWDILKGLLTTFNGLVKPRTA